MSDETKIQLSKEDSLRLRNAGRRRRNASVAAAAAQSEFAKAELEYQVLVEELADKHDFDAGVVMQFDDRDHTLVPKKS